MLRLPCPAARWTAGLTTFTLIAGMGVGALPTLAQDSGGVWLRFNLSQRFEHQTNADLLPAGQSEGSTVRSNTSLGFSLSSATRTDQLSLSLGGSLRHVEAPQETDDVQFGFKSPSASLSWTHAVGDSQLTAGASLSRTDISYLQSQDISFLTDDDTGTVVVDIDNIYDSGTQTQIRANAGLRLGINGPIETGFFVNTRRLRYSDAGSSYDDSDTNAISARLSLRLDPALTLSGGLGFSRFDETDADARDTWTLSTSLARQGSRGRLSGSLNLAKIEEGTRSSLSLGWQQPLPDGAVNVSLGLTQAASGGSGLTGGLTWNSEILPDIDASATLRHGFAANSDDQETRFTNASASLAAPLGALTSLNLGLNWVQNDVEDEDSDARQGSFNASISHELGQDWSLTTGYRRIHRREDDEDWAQSDILYLNVSRSFSVRY